MDSDKVRRWNDDGFTAYWRKKSLDQTNSLFDIYNLTYCQCEIILFLPRHAHHWFLSPQFDPVFLFIPLLYRPIHRVDARRQAFQAMSTNFFLIISIFVTVLAANNNNARDNRGNVEQRALPNTRIRTTDSFTIKALNLISSSGNPGEVADKREMEFDFPKRSIRKQW